MATGADARIRQILWAYLFSPAGQADGEKNFANDLAKEERTMKSMRQWQLLSLAGFGLMLAATTGCQTNIAGMTLPSGHYLQHPPQYFTPSPAFPLQRELAGMEAQGGGGLPAPGAPPLPPPAVVPPPPIPGAAPVNPLPGPNP